MNKQKEAAGDIKTYLEKIEDIMHFRMPVHKIFQTDPVKISFQSFYLTLLSSSFSNMNRGRVCKRTRCHTFDLLTFFA